MAQDQPGGCVDAVIGLGTACQVSSALYDYELHIMNSPLHGFGLHRWQRIIQILRNRFADYWQLENLQIMRVTSERSLRSFNPANEYYGQNTEMLTVFCKKHQMMSSYNFFLAENSLEGLTAYPRFRSGLDMLQNIFLRQCETYDDIRFVCKAFNAQRSEKTSVTQAHILDFLDVLAELRNGKPFTLALSVPAAHYDELREWILVEEIPNIHIAPWEVVWNHYKDQEWEKLFSGVKVASNHQARLVHEIIGDPAADLYAINCF